jgi:hypothetical protein
MNNHNRALNTQENAVKAIATARSHVGQLQAGQLWNHQAPRGELEIKGALLLDDIPVAGVRFSPDNGSVLPKGLHPIGGHNPAALAEAQRHLAQIASNLSVLEGAEFREPESCWAVPLAYAGRIIADLKISADGSTIVPDRKIQEELANQPQI